MLEETRTRELGANPDASFPPTHPLLLFSPLFVTWNKDARLRGCIGSLEPRPLRSGLARYALASALSDHRFPPVAQSELPSLACTVSFLSSFEPASHMHDWTLGTHGIVLHFEDGVTGGSRCGTYLPHVATEQGWSTSEAVDSLFRKAGHTGPITPSMRREARVTRYKATTASLDYGGWAKWKRGGGAGAGSA